jgi:triosephosphate isomerase
VAPPFTAVHAAAEAARNSPIAIAVQDVHWERDGAFTGEVSASMAKEAGAEFAIVGHSERRRLFQETDEIVNRKALAVLGAGLFPIVCVGETLEEREAGSTLEVLDRQIKQGLDGFTGDQIAALVVAYEPVWAIGTGLTATSEQAQDACGFVRALVAGFDKAAAQAVRILYGGSLKSEGAEELLSLPDIDGGLIGGASLDPKEFASIVQTAARMVAAA